MPVAVASRLRTPAGRIAPPAIRLRPAPALEPPYDDEFPPPAGVGATAHQGQLALERDPGPAPDDRPASTGGNTAGAEVPPAIGDGQPGTPAVTGVGGAPVSAVGGLSAAAGETKAAAGRFAQLCLEIFNGYRAAGHIRPLVRPAEASTIIEELADGVQRIRRRLARAANFTPGGRAGGRSRRDSVPLRLLRIWICEPRTGVAEVAVVLDGGGRSWALAFRIEHSGGRWLCTAVRLL